MRTHACPRKDTNAIITDAYEILLYSTQTTISSSKIPRYNRLPTVMLTKCQSKLTISYNHKQRDHSGLSQYKRIHRWSRSAEQYRQYRLAAWRVHGIQPTHLDINSKKDANTKFPYQKTSIQKDISQDRGLGVDKIVRHTGTGRMIKYVVSWNGYSSSEDTVKPPEQIQQLFIVQYWNRTK